MFGPVASDTTCWRVLDGIDAADLASIGAARAAAREVAWAQRGEATGAVLPASMVAGAPLLARDGRPVLVIDEDATLVIAHSEKDQAAATFKRSWGFHPVLAFCDNTNEALTGMLRPGQRRQQYRGRSHRVSSTPRWPRSRPSTGTATRS